LRCVNQCERKVSKERKQFFSEEKNQKTFAYAHATPYRATWAACRQRQQSKVFWFFSSEKNNLTLFLPLLSDKLLGSATLCYHAPMVADLSQIKDRALPIGIMRALNNSAGHKRSVRPCCQGPMDLPRRTITLALDDTPARMERCAP
jgi:hypothetical protein